MSLAQQVLAGDPLALARALTQIENQSPLGMQALSELHPGTGRAHRIGVTGAPGSGKSSLVNQLARRLRQEDQPPRIGIVAVDPTSPFSGGAILGDRIRMRELAGDRGVFIRSMASRGALGGLAQATSNTVDALDAAGFELVFIETVGSGQAEVDIAGAAHTVIVIEAPGMGDAVQALKAGLLEIADVLVVNKADLPGAEATANALRSALELGSAIGAVSEWEVPLLSVSAATGEGIEPLVEAIRRHGRHLRQSGEWEARERQRIERQLTELLRGRLVRRFLGAQPDGFYQETVAKVVERELSPQAAIDRLMSEE